MCNLFLITCYYDYICRYANYEDNSAAEGAVGYDHRAGQNYENLYEAMNTDPITSNQQQQQQHQMENIYETVEDMRAQMVREQPVYNFNDMPSCSSTYGRIGNAYGRIDVLGHGIGRIERHLSSSCGSIDSNHYAIESLYGTSDCTGRVSLQVNKLTMCSFNCV